MSPLPELMERKKRVDMHINLATALSDGIRARNLDKFFETEEKIMTKTTLEESVLEVMILIGIQLINNLSKPHLNRERGQPHLSTTKRQIMGNKGMGIQMGIGINMDFLGFLIKT